MLPAALRRNSWRTSIGRGLVAACLLLGWLSPTCLGDETLRSQGTQESVDPSAGILRVQGDVVHRWRDGDEDHTLLRGHCRVNDGQKTVTADQVYMIVDGNSPGVRCRLVMVGADVSHSKGGLVAASLPLLDVPDISAQSYRGFIEIPGEWTAKIQSLDQTQPSIEPASGIQLVQYTDPGLPGVGVPTPAIPIPDPTLASGEEDTGGWKFLVGGGSRSVELLSRGRSQVAQFQTFNRVEAGESIVIGRGGVSVRIRDVALVQPGGQTTSFGTVSLSANRIVAWLPTLGDILSGDTDIASADGELYLEGDIVFRAGDRIIYAESMYYNVTREVGVVLDAEAITSIPEYQGKVRVKAEAMRQLGRGRFLATGAAVTSSRMGVPRYWLQSNQLQLFDRPVAKLDPATGAAFADTEPYVTSGGNFVFLGGVPVLAWPRLTTPLRKPTFYLTGANIRNDDIFGTQVLLEWDLFQLLGLANPPDGVESILLTDFLSERGPAIGTRTTYQRTSLFGISGPVIGTYDSYLIRDDGLDVLGGVRRDLQPEEKTRGRTTLRHRHYLPGGWEFIGEIGYQSDRHFLEQYFEEEWDRDVDRTTGLRLRRYVGSQLFDFNLNVQLNDFFRETERLPSLDHYALGGAPLGSWLTWSLHNQVGYERLKPAEISSDPVVAAVTSTLPGEFDREGIVARTRQELSMPVQAGPVKVVPFAIGEASLYGEDVNGQDLSRLWGGGGIRANLPLSRIDPTIQSSLLNVRGLAHKIDLSAEYFYADSDTNYEELPYYDPLDDNAQEQFRRFFTFDTFGGFPIPDRFDPRSYALRQGIQRYVTSPSDTIADDLQQLRLGIKHRFQTKRGLPGRERIVDLFRLDLETVLFPDADRDNFGESIGPTLFDAQYNLGDRVTLLSDGYLDFFNDGLRSISAGLRTSRPGLGDFYVGLLSLEGPISSTVLRTTLDHRLNEKWIVSAANTYDFGDVGSVGQSFGLTRIGESFLVQLNASVDSGRDNTSFGFVIEPRFLPSPRLGRLGGQVIPPTGVEGLE